MTAGARLRIGGVLLPSEWDGSSLVAADGIAIRWGRTRPYDDPEPSVLTATIIDRTGAFISEQARIGQPVTVEMVDPARVMFRGSISKPTARRRRVFNPHAQANETVWVVTITAVDPLAALSMAIFPGDATDGMREGAGGWGEIGVPTRLARIFSLGVSGIVSGLDPVPEADPNIGRSMSGQLAADARTALELIQQAYRGQPLGMAAYDPATDMVRLVSFTTSSTAHLALASGVVKLDLPTGEVVPASRVGVDGYHLDSTVDTAIDAVQVSYVWYGKDPNLSAGAQKRTIYVDGFTEGRTARYDARTRRVLKIATQFMTFDPGEYVPGSVDRFNRFPGWLRDQVVAIVNKLNGQLAMPALSFDADRVPLPADLEDLIYRPVAPGVPLYFAGSVFNGIAGAGPQFQIIGGTLTYDDGWRHTVTVCATGPGTPSTLTLSQLVTNPTVALEDFDPDITLADLGYVTIGLSA
jgi:hypothetical protein